MRLQRLDLDDRRWCSFVDGRPEATAFHEPAWAQMLADVYRRRAFALALLSPDGSVVAGLPVIASRRRWVSLPFTDACAPLAVTADAARELVSELETTRSACGLASIEVRSGLTADSAHCMTPAFGHTLARDPDPAAVLPRLHRSQAQRQIQRARREGVVVRVAERVRDLDHTFFDLQVETRRRLGAPVQPRRFYTMLWRRMIEPGHGFVLLAYADRVPVAGAVFLRGHSTITYKFGASDAAYWSLGANALVFWTAIELGCTSGATTLDYGRTETQHESLRTFKRHWSTDEQPLVYTVLGDEAHEVSPTFRAAAGAVIRRSPPWVCRTVGALYKFAS